MCRLEQNIPRLKPMISKRMFRYGESLVGSAGSVRTELARGSEVRAFSGITVAAVRKRASVEGMEDERVPSGLRVRETKRKGERMTRGWREKRGETAARG